MMVSAGYTKQSFQLIHEHRYGEPLNAIGDFVAMRLIRCVLKPDGLLFLTLPIGPDLIVHNLLRR